jgi:hypothetical protein
LSKKRVRSRKSDPKKIHKPTASEPKIDYPIFCFKHLKLDFKKDHEYYFRFVERIQKLSQLTWKQINVAHRHGFGTEKMPVGEIKPDLPNFVTPYVTDLTVFRANGDNRPFLGLRKNNIFHIIFLEETFGDVYNHD